ncbi:unnamed protein product [Fraxinus pennsylvanica]|uniref:Uncharacterized protein n=1 Tax=Fraxinus pennsylvanica TaxID=56036 RepID=A0AAD2A0V6_9LAMI|nr:unnamed protein product [Fraxinus pennsylvanica]
MLMPKPFGHPQPSRSRVESYKPSPARFFSLPFLSCLPLLHLETSPHLPPYPPPPPVPGSIWTTAKLERRQILIPAKNKCSDDTRKLNIVGLVVKHCKAEDMGNRRLKGTSGNKKQKMSAETKLLFDQLTEDAIKLMESGDYNVCDEKQESFQREAGLSYS